MPHQATPATSYTARPKATPGERLDTHDRVRTDRIDQAGVITLRLAGRLHHIGVGRTYTGTRVLILVPTRDYQPTGAPKAPNGKSPEPNAGSELFRCLETSHW